MHAIAQWVSTLSEQGIKLYLDDGALKFSAPKGVITNDIKSQLKERKADILKFLGALGVSPQQEREDKKIARQDHSKGYLLSWEQQRFWLLEQLADVSTGNSFSPEAGFANNIVAAIKIDGDFDIEALQSGVDQIVARHSVLRTNFAVEQGEIVQIVHPHRHTPILLEDYRQLSEIKALEFAKAKLSAESKHRYQLMSDSLLRINLVILGDKSRVLIINLHHIIADGWSFSIFIQELAECYNAHKKGVQPALPPLVIQYADYCDWQQHTSNNLLERQRKYWLEKLQGELSPLSLPSVVSLAVPLKETSVSELDGAVVKQPLSVETSRQLKNLAVQQNTSLFTVMLAVFKLLFSRLGNQEDIIIGTPVAGRNLSNTENLIGLFINTLALRTDFSGNPDFLQILARVREVTLSAFENQDFSFEKIVEQLNPPREKYRHPIFDVMFNFINTPDQHIQFPGSKVEPLEIVERHAPFQLALYIEEEHVHPINSENGKDEQQLVLRLLYKKAFYSVERMEILLAQYHSLLIQVLENPTRPVSDYSLVTECARRLPDPHAVLDYPVQDSVLAMFRQQCLRSSTAIACRYYGAGGELHSISYQQLYNSSAELSACLQANGLCHADVIAVSGIQGYATIVAVLGVLMAGGVFLALDDALPDARKTEILQQANARYLLIATSHEHLHYGQAACAFIPSGCKQISCQLNENHDGTDNKLNSVHFNAVAEGAAYIYFTSGSTGKPKGVLGTHKGLAHFVHWQVREFSISPEYRCAQLTNFSFDVFLRDMFLPLTTGATLCLPSRADILEPDNILRWLAQEEVSLMHVVPSLCRSWLQNASGDYSLSALRHIFFAGEPLDASLIEHLRLNQLRDNSQVTIVNLYGPTETTLAKCFFRVPTPALPGIQPIGQPLPGSQLLILNVAGHLCGIGEVGEINIRTPFMSKGYVNNEVLTNQSFIPRHDLTGTDERLYKTGDLGRYTHDGTIEIFGRKDRQVKIRGIRIELEEIRNRIKSHPDVIDAAVIVKSLVDSSALVNGSESQLIAYVVVKSNRQDQGNGMAGLRRYVKEQLPPYMVPAYLCAIDKLPLNKNGKLDINQLPAPTQENLDGLEYQPASTSTEEKLVHMWENLLNQTNIGIHDDFFTLGGHSIMAVRLMARLRDGFGKNFPIGMLFENSTIEKLAAAIDSNAEYHWRSLIKMNGDVGNKYSAQHSAAPKNLFCIPGGGGNIMYLHELCEALGSDINVYGLQAKGLDGKSTPHQTIEETAKHYINEIKSVQGTGPYHITGHSFGGKIAFEIANQLSQQGDTPGVLALLDSAAPQYISSDKEKINQWTQAQWIVHTASIVEQLCGIPADITCDDLDPLDDHQQLHVFNRYLQRVGWIPDAADTSYLVGQINILKANSQTEYSPQHKLASHITYFRATHPMPGIDAETHASANPAAEWQCHSEKPIDYIAVPGNHLTMLSKPHVDVLAQHIHKLFFKFYDCEDD
jgi:amino acid adenylation domain-containing protein